MSSFNSGMQAKDWLFLPYGASKFAFSKGKDVVSSFDLLGTGKDSTGQGLSLTTPQVDDAAKAAAKAEADRLRKRRGIASTILTQGLGEATTLKTKLGE